jgi:enoyl-CoA hydratase
VSGDEALSFGLANQLAEPGAALDGAVALAHELALPQLCLRSDRRSSYEQWALSLDDALSNEFERGQRRSRRARRWRARHASRRVRAVTGNRRPDVAA